MATVTTPTKAGPETKAAETKSEPKKGSGLTLSNPGEVTPKSKTVTGKGIPVGYSGRLIRIDN